MSEQKKAPFLQTAKRFCALLSKHKTIIGFLLLVIILIEGVNLLERYLFKLIIDHGTAFSSGAISKEAFIGVIGFIAALFVSGAILRATCKWLLHRLISTLESNVITELKRKFFNHIVRLSHRFHTTHKSGSLIARLTRGSRAVEKMMDTLFFYIINSIVLFIGSIIAIATINPGAAITLAATIIVFLGASLIMIQIRYPLTVALNDVDDREKGTIGDIFANIESIKYYGKEAHIQSRYENLSEKTRHAMRRAWNFYSWVDLTQHLILAIGLFILIYLPLHATLQGTSTIGDLVFIYAVYTGVVGFLFRSVQSMRDYYQSSADLDSLYTYDEQHNEIEDKPHAKALLVKKGAIVFKNVSFSYGKRVLFDDFTLTIKPGEKVAVVGSSGAGKSTLIKLLYRFYDVQQGTISVDGVDIRNVKQESLRAELSIVPQECILFDDTIENNIAFSQPGASKDEIVRAMQLSQLDKLIASMPHKEHTIVGERGVKLSGGEKQRVSIARALLANKKILVLDEATSSLDSETEHEIQKDLQELMRNRTSIIIAHRLSTIMAADRIIVVENGKIVQQGNHKTLIKKKGRYQALWQLQRGGYL